MQSAPGRTAFYHWFQKYTVEGLTMTFQGIGLQFYTFQLFSFSVIIGLVFFEKTLGLQEHFF